jgi:hypothetical protein
MVRPVMIEKNTSTSVQPRAPGRGEVWPYPRVLLEPVLRVFVGGVVVAGHEHLAAGIGGGDRLEELQELLVAMAREAGIGDWPVAISNAPNSVVMPCWR